MKTATQIKSEPKPPFKRQKQKTPGLESKITPRPAFEALRYKAAGKLKGKKALVTGGDSGIGRAVAVLFAREGADVAITFLPNEKSDAKKTQDYIQNKVGGKCHLIEGDLTQKDFCKNAVIETVETFGTIDILVSNAAHQMRKKSLDELDYDEWDKTFKTNIYAYFLLVKEAVKHMKAGSAIIATSSETAFLGPEELPDYSATKGAINTFTKSLAQMLIGKGIRVNAVAPGPVWTPLNVADQGSSKSDVSKFGSDQPVKRPAQPEELAPAYVFLASDADSSYVTGAILAVTGGLPIS